MGGIFALALYALFQGGVIEGAIVPSFQGCADGFTTYGAYVNACKPRGNGDVALALVWAFVAGFAENFVPNVFDKMVAGQSGPDGSR